MSDKRQNTIYSDNIEVISEDDALLDTEVAGQADKMDSDEAAIVAKVLARAMVAAEEQGGLSATSHRFNEEELLAAEAAEQKVRESFSGHVHIAISRILSVITPDNKELAIPAVIAEVLVLAALIGVLIRYSHVAPDTPTLYSSPEGADIVTCLDGTLIVNNVNAPVPADPNVNYSISYAWAEDDTDYPSVPHAITASYKDASGGTTLYEISLYKDSFVAREDIPKDKNAKNWFSDWDEDHSDNIDKFQYEHNGISGFCIEDIDSGTVPDNYRNYSYYFAVPESKGISIYILEGVCYDDESTDAFRDIMKASIQSVTTDNKGV